MRVIGAVVAIASILSCNGDPSSPTSPTSSVPPPGAVSPGAAGGVSGIWVARDRLSAQPMGSASWGKLEAEARASCGSPRLGNQDDGTNVCVMAKALVYARTGNAAIRGDVIAALRSIVEAGAYRGRALALGRELGAYVIAADLVALGEADAALDVRFRQTVASLLTAPTSDGPANLIECHERRPNNWGTHCGASRAAVAAYLGDRGQLARVAQVFRGWLGERASYAGFEYGDDLSWQCDAAAPVGINPRGCIRDGRSIDGVLADDQRRGGAFRWPPPRENYVYEALQGALAQAIILQRAGYDPFNWGDRALLRAFEWLHDQANYPAEGDDTWQPHVINHYYQTRFPAPVPARAGKNVGWTDWTHGAY